MKKIIKFLFLFVFVHSTYSQTILTEEVNNKDIANFIGSVKNLEHYNIKIGSLTTVINSDKSNSAKITETDEVFDNLIVTICSDESYNDCKSYIFNDKYDIKVLKVTEDDTSYNILVEYGFFNKRKHENLIIKKVYN